MTSAKTIISKVLDLVLVLMCANRSWIDPCSVDFREKHSEKSFTFFFLFFRTRNMSAYLGRQLAVVGGGGQGGEAEARLAGGEGGRRLHERRSVAEGAEPSLLGEQLLVGHGVDGMREGEGRAARSKEDQIHIRSTSDPHRIHIGPACTRYCCLI